MAFFNLAHLGPQDSIKAKLRENNSSQPPREGSADTRPTESPKEDCVTSRDKSPSSCTSGNRPVEPSGPTPDAATQGFTKKTPWHKGSHVKYTDLLRKHQRNPEGLPKPHATGIACRRLPTFFSLN